MANSNKELRARSPKKLFYIRASLPQNAKWTRLSPGRIQFRTLSHHYLSQTQTLQVQANDAMSESWSRVALIGSAAFALGAATTYAVNRWSKLNQPSFEPVGTLTNIFIYPIKSCRGIEVKEAYCCPLGLRYGDAVDRSFLITDDKYHFITARQESRLVLVQPSFHDGQLWLDAPGMETFKLPPPKPDANRSDIHGCKIWGQVSRGIDCGREVGAWFESFLGRKEGTIRLLYHPWESRERIPDFWDKWERFKKTDTCIFADLCPYMMINASSVDDFNERVEDKSDVTCRNFRPNFIVTGCRAYAEDEWKYVRVNEKCFFRGVRPCTRCVVTTINPETGVRGAEPLKTLKTYRQLPDPAARKREGDSPVMGLNLGLDRGDVIRVGDTIHAAI